VIPPLILQVVQACERGEGPDQRLYWPCPTARVPAAGSRGNLVSVKEPVEAARVPSPSLQDFIIRPARNGCEIVAASRRNRRRVTGEVCRQPVDLAAYRSLAGAPRHASTPQARIRLELSRLSSYASLSVGPNRAVWTVWTRLSGKGNSYWLSQECG